MYYTASLFDNLNRWYEAPKLGIVERVYGLEFTEHGSGLAVMRFWI
jgi:hypothetical protein